MQLVSLKIEFIGGPFDGHTAKIENERAKGLPILTVPSHLEQPTIGRDDPATDARKLAYYELVQRASGWQYRYWGTKPNPNYESAIQRWIAKAVHRFQKLCRTNHGIRLHKRSSSWSISMTDRHRPERNSRCQ